jgi:hypothetical protein
VLILLLLLIWLGVLDILLVLLLDVLRLINCGLLDLLEKARLELAGTSRLFDGGPILDD